MRKLLLFIKSLIEMLITRAIEKSKYCTDEACVAPTLVSRRDIYLEILSFSCSCSWIGDYWNLLQWNSTKVLLTFRLLCADIPLQLEIMRL